MSSKYYLPDGSRLTTGAKIGSGGEGIVLRIAGTDRYVAKLFHKPDPERTEKLLALIGLREDALEMFCAWPIAAIRSGPSDLVAGFLMRAISSESKEIHLLCTPRTRRTEFPRATWPFVLRAAENVARSFAAVHAKGVVVGDINERSVLVDPDDATASLIDCDSFQVTAGGKTFRCQVGVPTYTPPELQNRALGAVDRNVNHDAFGLAVMIFHLLYLGRHPYAGRYLRSGDMPIEQAIAEHRFVYGRSGRSFLMEPPPGAVPLSAAGATIAEMFEAAFAPDSAFRTRPSAAEWVRALSDLQRMTTACSKNGSHHHTRGQACPWCVVEATAPGLVLFPPPPVAVPPTQDDATPFDLSACWSLIESIPPLRRAPMIWDRGVVAEPSERVRSVRRGRWVPWIVLGPIGAGVAALGVAGEVPAPSAWVGTIGLALVSWATGRIQSRVPKEMRERLWSAQQAWAELVTRWDRDAIEFARLLQRLGVARTELRKLPDEHQRQLSDLRRSSVKAQRESFLQSRLIEHASISGIGPSRKATLRSWGIVSAADVSEARLTPVPGFGDARISTMLSWRRRVEAGFGYDPSKAIDPKAAAQIQADIAAKAAALRAELETGLEALRSIRRRAEIERQALRSQLDIAWLDLKQAEADLRFLGAL